MCVCSFSYFLLFLLVINSKGSILHGFRLLSSYRRYLTKLNLLSSWLLIVQNECDFCFVKFVVHGYDRPVASLD